MGRAAGNLLFAFILLFGLPLLGAGLFGSHPLSVYFDFPPRPGRVAHAPFSWPVFFLLAACIAACLAPFVRRAVQGYQRGVPPETAGRRPFAAWGYAGAAVCAAAWVLAWTRFEWFSAFQPYTFPFLWIGYILVVNAATARRTGTCLMVRKTTYFFALFPASAVFWWFFEYLNRFVLNWYYIRVDMFSAAGYIVYASACFATVLPAVLSTAELLQSFSFFKRTYGDFIAVRPATPRIAAGAVLGAAAAGLFFLGVFPNFLFALLWIAPFLIIVCLQVLAGREHIFSPLRRGDWSRVVCLAAAALVCGFFWEMWNYFSFAKWEYSIPFVCRFRIFEMPLLGYAGYLPFGLECGAVGDMLEKRIYASG